MSSANKERAKKILTSARSDFIGNTEVAWSIEKVLAEAQTEAVETVVKKLRHLLDEKMRAESQWARRAEDRAFEMLGGRAAGMALHPQDADACASKMLQATIASSRSQVLTEVFGLIARACEDAGPAY